MIIIHPLIRFGIYGSFGLWVAGSGCDPRVEQPPQKAPASGFELSQTFVINLDRSPERLRYMQDQLGQANMPFTRVAGVDGKKAIGESGLERLKEKGIIQFWPERFEKQLSLGEVGIFLTQRHIWAKIVKDNLPFALIFEDDAIIPPQLALQIQSWIQHAPAGWDMLHLGCHPAGCPWFLMENTEDNYWSLMNDRCVPGAHAYIVSQAAAKKMLANSLPLVEPVDLFMRQLVMGSHGVPFHGYCANPALVYPNPNIASIIDEYGR